MSLNAATIAVLIAKGLTAEDLLEVARATEVKADRTNAERQARHRRKRNAVTVTDAPPIDNSLTPLSPSEPEGSSGDNVTRSGKDFPKPEWADPQVWKDFLANRKKRRMTNSPTAYRGFLGDINRLSDDEWPPGRLLELAAIRGWGSINRPDQDNRNGQRQQPVESPLARIRREASEAEREAPQAGGRNGAPLPPEQPGGNLLPSGQAGAADRGFGGPSGPPH